MLNRACILICVFLGLSSLSWSAAEASDDSKESLDFKKRFLCLAATLPDLKDVPVEPLRERLFVGMKRILGDDEKKLGYNAQNSGLSKLAIDMLYQFPDLI